MSCKMAKSTNNVHGVIGLDFQKASIVKHFTYDICHIVGFVGVFWNHVGQGIAGAVGVIRRLSNRCSIHVVRRKHIAEITRQLNGCIIAFSGKMRDTRFRCMCHGTTQVFERNDLVRDRLDDLWTGDEHVRRFVNHDDKICNRWTVNCSTSTWPHDDANLWNDTGRTYVPEENFSVRSE